MIAAALADYEGRIQADVAQYIQTKIDEHEQKVGTLVQAGGSMVDQLKSQTFFLTQAGADAQTRADAIINSMNSTSSHLEENHSSLRQYVDDLKKSTADTINGIVGKFNAEGETVKEDIADVKKVVENVATDGANKLDAKISEVYAWSVRFKNEVQADIEKRTGGETGRSNFNIAKGDRGDRPVKLDKKEIAVNRIPDTITKAEFRQWLRSVELQLETTYEFVYPEIVLHKVRLSKVAITEAVLENIIDDINEEYKVELEAKKIEWTSDKVEKADWEFEVKSRWLYSYLYTKLNADMALKTVHVEERNGLEVYRLVNNMIDAIPENAQFYLDCEFGEMVRDYAAKVKTLKDTCAFKVTLKLKASEYYRVTGERPLDDKLKQTLWNVVDINTKRSSTRDKMQGKSFVEISEYLDEMYKTEFGAIDFSKNKGDPMDLSLVGKEEPPKGEGEEEAERQDLDALGKGKGKGKDGGGKGWQRDFKCHNCGGRDHYARDCPTAVDSTATHKCNTCEGKGHYSR